MRLCLKAVTMTIVSLPSSVSLCPAYMQRLARSPTVIHGAGLADVLAQPRELQHRGL